MAGSWGLLDHPLLLPSCDTVIPLAPAVPPLGSYPGQRWPCHAEQRASACPRPPPALVRWPSPRRPSAPCRSVANQRRGTEPLAAIHERCTVSLRASLLGFQPRKCLWALSLAGVWAVGSPPSLHPACNSLSLASACPTSGTITCLIHSHAP